MTTTNDAAFSALQAALEADRPVSNSTSYWSMLRSLWKEEPQRIERYFRPDTATLVSGLSALPPGLDWMALDRVLALGAQSPSLFRWVCSKGAPVVGQLGVGPCVATDKGQLLGAVHSTSRRTLADFRRFHVADIFLREVRGELDGADVLSAITHVAEVCIARALELAYGNKTRPVDAAGEIIPFVVFGLGKLGGGELNYNSDVDLVYAYGTDDAQGEEWAAHTFYKALAKEVSAILHGSATHSRVWCVDLRLRPQGARGPLVHSHRALVRHYRTWGGTFERAVWLKARAVAGDVALGEAILADLGSFVYRRHLDTRVLEDLRDMKARIDAHAASGAFSTLPRKATSPHARWDCKVGRGGIREIEFSVQVLQLLAGGRLEFLREKGTLRALGALLAAGLLPAQDVLTLRQGYLFLREIEHRVQMEEERQTQLLPATDDGLARLAGRLGLTLPEFDAALGMVRDRVHQIFSVVLGHIESDHKESAQILAAIDSGDSERALLALAKAGFQRPKQSLAQLEALQSRFGTPFSQGASRELRRFAYKLLSDVAVTSDADLALVHLTRLIIQCASDPGLMVSLSAHEQSRRMVLNLFGASRYLADRFLRLGRLKTQLQSPEHLLHRPAFPAFREGQVEKTLVSLREYKARAEIYAALHCLGGLMTPAQTMGYLSDVAVAIVKVVAEQAMFEVQGNSDLSGFCVLAMGSLGAGTMGFGSDLDLVFVYESEAGTVPTAFTRVARRIIHFLNAQVGTGRLYEPDMRLRPNGGRGALVVSQQAFLKYHHEHAEFGERVALAKARPVCGGPKLVESLERGIRQELGETTGVEKMRDEASELRRRVASALGDSSRLDLKYAEGALFDLEMVRFFQLLGRGSLGQEAFAVGPSGDLAEAWAWQRRLALLLSLREGRSTRFPKLEQHDELGVLACLAGVDGGSEGLIKKWNSARTQVSLALQSTL